MEDKEKIFPDHIVATVGRNVSFKCYSETVPHWKFVEAGKFKERKLKLRNVKVIKGNRTHGYDLKITKVNYANNGWYYCYGQHSYVDFSAIGYLEVNGK